MMDVEASYSDFINCDRTGRRNAVPDITREGGEGPAGTSELAKDMAEMDLKAAGRLTCRVILMRHGPSGTPAQAFIFVKLGLCTVCLQSPGGFLPFSILTIVNYSVVISDFRLSHRRVSHDMITAAADKSHSSTVALWEAFNGSPIVANRVQREEPLVLFSGYGSVALVQIHFIWFCSLTQLNICDHLMQIRMFKLGQAVQRSEPFAARTSFGPSFCTETTESKWFSH